MSGHVNVNKMEVEPPPTQQNAQANQTNQNRPRSAEEKKLDKRTEFSRVELKGTDEILLGFCQKFQKSPDNEGDDDSGKKRTHEVASRASQSTQAFGIYEKDGKGYVVVALQKGAKLAQDQLPTKLEQYKSYRQDIVPNKLASTGLHAEMMIIRHLMIERTIDVADVTRSADTIHLRIGCPGKLVCPDCSGWLKKHGIPHYPPNAGTQSPNWVNPRTGACFRVLPSGRDVTFYQKNAIGGTRTVGDSVESGKGNLKPLKSFEKPSKLIGKGKSDQ